MKIEGQKGEFAYKALFNISNGWELSNNFYFENPFPTNKDVKWPVEEISPGCIYIPSAEELEEENHEK